MKHRLFSEIRLNLFCNLSRVALSIVLLLTMLSIATEQPVHAAVIAVNTIDDEDNTDGDCSLREAIHAANNNVARDACVAGSGTDVIDLTGVTGTIILSGYDLEIYDNLTINGSGADKLTIDGNYDGRVFNIWAATVVVISDVTIADGNSTGGDGGGIMNSGILTINRCTFSGNQSSSSGGGIANAGWVTVNQSTFYNNQAGYNGGAINNRATLDIQNSTFSGNRASEGSFDNYGGGAINNMKESGTAYLTIDNSTIAFNSAKWGGGLSNNLHGLLTVKNTILAENTVHSGGAGPNCYHYNSITTSSYNLESGTDCGFTGIGDIQNASAELGALQNNGGTTSTHALQISSNAINSGSCTDSGGSTVVYDQRGFPRLTPCDIGAFEYILSIYLPLVTSN